MFATLTVLLSDLAMLLLAQPAPPGGGGGAIQQVPLDGGLALLAVVGGGYAVRKLRQRA